MYTRFHESYYNVRSQPLLDVDRFKNIAPLTVVNCSKQNVYLRSAPVDIRFEFKAKEACPANATTNCLIFHDKSFAYDPSTNLVQKIM